MKKKKSIYNESHIDLYALERKSLINNAVFLLLVFTSSVVELIVFKEESLVWILFSFLLLRLVNSTVSLIISKPLFNKLTQYELYLIIVSFFEALFAFLTILFLILKITYIFFFCCFFSFLFLLLELVGFSLGMIGQLDKDNYQAAESLISTLLTLVIVTVLFLTSVKNELIRDTLTTIIAALIGGLLTLLGVIYTINNDKLVNESKERRNQEAHLNCLFPLLVVIDPTSIPDDRYVKLCVRTPGTIPSDNNTIYLMAQNECLFMLSDLLICEGESEKSIPIYPPLFASDKNILCISSEEFYPKRDNCKIGLKLALVSEYCLANNCDIYRKYYFGYSEECKIECISFHHKMDGNENTQ